MIYHQLNRQVPQVNKYNIVGVDQGEKSDDHRDTVKLILLPTRGRDRC